MFAWLDALLMVRLGLVVVVSCNLFVLVLNCLLWLGLLFWCCVWRFLLVGWVCCFTFWVVVVCVLIIVDLLWSFMVGVSGFLLDWLLSLRVSVCFSCFCFLLLVCLFGWLWYLGLGVTFLLFAMWFAFVCVWLCLAGLRAWGSVLCFAICVVCVFYFAFFCCLFGLVLVCFACGLLRFVFCLVWC